MSEEIISNVETDTNTETISNVQPTDDSDHPCPITNLVSRVHEILHRDEELQLTNNELKERITNFKTAIMDHLTNLNSAYNTHLENINAKVDLIANLAMNLMNKSKEQDVKFEQRIESIKKSVFEQQSKLNFYFNDQKDRLDERIISLGKRTTEQMTIIQETHSKLEERLVRIKQSSIDRISKINSQFESQLKDINDKITYINAKAAEQMKLCEENVLEANNRIDNIQIILKKPVGLITTKSVSAQNQKGKPIKHETEKIHSSLQNSMKYRWFDSLHDQETQITQSTIFNQANMMLLKLKVSDKVDSFTNTSPKQVPSVESKMIVGVVPEKDGGKLNIPQKTEVSTVTVNDKFKARNETPIDEPNVIQKLEEAQEPKIVQEPNFIKQPVSVAISELDLESKMPPDDKNEEIPISPDTDIE